MNNIMTLNEYFDKIYCINLDEATERWDMCVEQFNKYNINVERFPGIKIDSGLNGLLKGEIGILRTNYEIIKKAKELNLNNVLILEDDFLFIENFNEIFNFMVKQVPDNWDFLYFGANHVNGINYISPNVAKMNRSYALHTFAVKNTMFDKILNILPNEKLQVDVYYADMMPSCNAYVLRPHISFQREGFSYIQNRITDYNFLKR
jgi:hypothetical protein